MNGRWPGIGIARAAAVPWTPADITTTLWLDGSDPLSKTVVGPRVSQWRDKSGNNRHLANANDAFRPNDNALGIVGNRGFLWRNETAPAGVNSKAHFIVYLVNTAAFISGVQSGVSCWATWPVAETNNYMFDTFVGDNSGQSGGLGLLYQPANNGGDVTHSINTTAAQGLLSMFAGCWDATSGTGVSAAWLNSVSAPDTTPGDSNWPLTAFAGDQVVAVGRYLGSIAGVPSQSSLEWNLHSELFCVIETTAPILIANRERLEGWAAHTFGITARLPANHPYKNAPPTK
jgi:hypothetical protein